MSRTTLIGKLTRLCESIQKCKCPGCAGWAWVGWRSTSSVGASKFNNPQK
jgi:hypothetical protein